MKLNKTIPCVSPLPSSSFSPGDGHRGNRFQQRQVGRSARVMAPGGGRGGQLPGPSSGRESNRPHSGRVSVLAARVLLQLGGRRATVLGRHSDAERQPGERHDASHANT